MPRYDVTVPRTELITFRVEADTAEEADENAFSGDEMGSKTIDCETTSVVEVTD